MIKEQPGPHVTAASGLANVEQRQEDSLRCQTFIKKRFPLCFLIQTTMAGIDWSRG